MMNRWRRSAIQMAEAADLEWRVSTRLARPRLRVGPADQYEHTGADEGDRSREVATAPRLVDD
jgi:hypothetical protein